MEKDPRTTSGSDCRGPVAAAALTLAGAATDTPGADDGIVLLRLTAAAGGSGPTCLDVHLARRGNRFARGFAERFNRAAHDVDASGLTLDGDCLKGRLRIVLQPDQWQPEAPVPCEIEIAAPTVAAGQWRGACKGTVGETSVYGEVRADERSSPLAADYANATARLYLHDGFLTDDWDRDAAAELDIRDGTLVRAVAYREGAAEMDVGSLRFTPESLAGECRVTHRGQAPCAMRFAGTVVGPWIGGVLELAAEGRARARRTFRGHVVFAASPSLPATPDPVLPVPDPAPLWSAERASYREILKAKARALSDAFEARSFTPPHGDPMVYRLFKPSGRDGENKLPLVLFLHGADARGKDNVKNYTHFGMLLGARIWALPEHQARHPCFVVAPQTRDAWSGDRLNAALSLVDALCDEFGIDRDRIYVTGLSLGGFGTFRALAARPRMFAAAVPVCGGGKPDTAASFAHVPMWVFHGARDELVKPEESRRMIEALRKAGGTPAYTEYEGVGHNSFVEAYSEPALVDWVMAQGLGVRR